MRAGALRHRIEIGHYVQGKDEWGDPLVDEKGNPIMVWETIATVWGAVEALSGSTYFEAKQSMVAADHRVRIRYRPDVKPKMVVLHDGRHLQIEAVLDQTGRKEELVLLTQEVEPA